MEETHVHALDYLTVFQRRKWWLIVPIALSIVVGIVLLQLLPKEYTSTATLAVAAPAVSPNLVNQSAPLDNQELMRLLTQQLKSAPILSRVATEERLSDATNERTIGQLRRAINITVPEPVTNTNEIRRLDSFIISIADADPARAQRLNNRLVNVFVDESSKTASRTGTWLRTTFESTNSKWHDQGDGRSLIGISCNQMGNRASSLYKDACSKRRIPARDGECPRPPNGFLTLLITDAYCLR